MLYKKIISEIKGEIKPEINLRIDGLTNNKYVICMTDRNGKNIFYGILNENLTYHQSLQKIE